MKRQGWRHKDCDGEICAVLESDTISLDSAGELEELYIDYYECQYCGETFETEEELQDFAKWGEL